MPTKPQNAAVAEAFKLWSAFGGRQHRRIEQIMREKGYASFSRRVFHGRSERGRVTPGWIKRYNWEERSRRGQRAAAPPHTRPTPIPIVAKDKGPRPATKLSSFANAKREIIRPVKNSSAVAAPSPGTATTTVDRKKTPPASQMNDSNFKNWLRRISPNMQWDAKHQEYLYEKLAAVTNGTCKRLMIFMPPRHGKSELVTVRYAAWRLRQDPQLNIILGSYSQQLANRFSRKVRSTWQESVQKDAEAQGRPSTAETQRRRKEIDRDRGDEMDQEGNKCQTRSSIPCTAFVPVDSSPPRLGVSAVNTSRNRSNTVAEWETGRGGGVRAVGVGGGITGYGAGLVIIDDPVKSRAEAESGTYRDRLYEWFNDDIYTRLEPGAPIIIIQTRWHEDDLSGRLIQEMTDGGEHWDVISLPALAEANEDKETRDKRQESSPVSISPVSISPVSPSSSRVSAVDVPRLFTDGNATVRERAIVNGSEPADHPGGNATVRERVVIRDPLNRQPGDALWPERYSREELLRIKRKIGSYSFSALYQQRPTPLEGGLFKKVWFKQIVPAAPQGLRWYRGYDLAISTKTSADFTASARCAFDRNGNIYIADVFRMRLEYPDQRRFVTDRMMNERDTEHGIEAALHSKAFIQDLRRLAHLSRYALREVRVTSDKFTRALAWANRAEEGKIILVRGPWIQTFLDEVCSFPNAAHDDQVDAVSLCVQMMEERKRLVWTF